MDLLLLMPMDAIRSYICMHVMAPAALSKHQTAQRWQRIRAPSECHLEA